MCWILKGTSTNSTMASTKDIFKRLKVNQLNAEHPVKPQAADGMVLLATKPSEISSELKNFLRHGSSDDMELEPGH